MASGFRHIGGIGRGAPIHSTAATMPATMPGSVLGTNNRVSVNASSGFGIEQSSFGNATSGFGNANTNSNGFGTGSFGGGNTAGQDVGSGNACRKCGQFGHFARECPNGGVGGGNRGGGRGCFKCGGEGHISKDCTGGTGGTENGGFGGASGFGSANDGFGGGFGGSGDGGGARGKGCFNCGQDGHMSKDCPEPRGGGGARGKGCFNCGQDGYMSKDCPEPRKPREGGRSGGGAGGFGGGGFGSADAGGGFGGTDSSDRRKKVLLGPLPQARLLPPCYSKQDSLQSALFEIFPRTNRGNMKIVTWFKRNQDQYIRIKCGGSQLASHVFDYYSNTTFGEGVRIPAQLER